MATIDNNVEVLYYHKINYLSNNDVTYEDGSGQVFSVQPNGTTQFRANGTAAAYERAKQVGSDMALFTPTSDKAYLKLMILA